ncbi:hypothetical protein [Patulibacter defluvii]|uniref:hypothetical protein n=1 Tax=Patulibacter defluvii TaxID=3095358 RepID=UPI002A7647C7|nr:hypothetical protein [Patulibacter sp. DM4]
MLWLEVPLNALWGADRQARRMLKGLQASDGCRDYVLGPRRAVAPDRVNGARGPYALDPVPGGAGRGGEPVTPAQLAEAADAYDSETRGLARVMNRTGAIPATACREDV